MGIISKIRSPLQRRVRPGIIVPDMPSDLTLLIDARSGVLNDRLRNGLSYVAAAGNVPNGLGGVQSSVIPPVHADGFYGGPAYTNLFANTPTAPEDEVLTVQKYCLQCVGTGASVDAGAYGVAVPETPLIFTAAAASQTFTPNGSTAAWMLSAAGGHVFKVIPPGTSVVSTVGTTTNGLSVPLSGSSKADRLKTCFQGTTTVACLVKMGAGSADLPSVIDTSILAVKNVTAGALWFSRNAADIRILRSFDGVTSSSLTGISWDRNEYHLKIVETGGGKFRVGNRRYTSAMAPIDANIVWSHATLAAGVAFDGSFNPLTFLRFFYTSTVPMWLKMAWVSDQSGLGDAEILDRLSYAGH